MSGTEIMVNRTVACVIALASFAASARAADLDLDKLKDPLPDTLSWQGITFYGTINLGGVNGHQTHGAPRGSSHPQGVAYNIYSAKYGNRAISSLDPNALEPSKIGLIIEEAISSGWVAVGRLEMGFHPPSGQLSDGPGSLLENAGLPLSLQSANGDSRPPGPGLQRPILCWRQQQDLWHPYSRTSAVAPAGSDWLVRSARRLLCFWPAPGRPPFPAPALALRPGRTVVKYVFTYGPFHAAGMYSQGGPDVAVLAWPMARMSVAHMAVSPLMRFTRR